MKSLASGEMDSGKLSLPLRMFWKIFSWVLSKKGGSPVNISKIKTPRLYQSIDFPCPWVRSRRTTFFVEHFRRQVGHRPAEGLRALVDALHADLGQPEVGQQRVALQVEDHVFGLEVPVNDVVPVQVLDGQQDLAGVDLDLAL